MTPEGLLQADMAKAGQTPEAGGPAFCRAPTCSRKDQGSKTL
jgi:hypothetical protein